MRALVIHESLTGNTRKAAQRLVAELAERGRTATECNAKEVDLAALQQADVLVVGTWVDGLILFGQRPGGAGTLSKLPLLGGKPTYTYVTYAVNDGKTLDKLSALLDERGADVRGGMRLRRDRLEAGCSEFADLIAAAAQRLTPS